MDKLGFVDYRAIIERNRVAGSADLVTGMGEMYGRKKVMVETFEVAGDEVRQTKTELGERFDIELRRNKKGEHPVLNYVVEGELKTRHMLAQQFVYEKKQGEGERESLIVCWKSVKTGKEMMRRFSMAE